jgi:hypothetical protein
MMHEPQQHRIWQKQPRRPYQQLVHQKQVQMTHKPHRATPKAWMRKMILGQWM